jgi:hypothetical protein
MLESNARLFAAASVMKTDIGVWYDMVRYFLSLHLVHYSELNMLLISILLWFVGVGILMGYGIDGPGSIPGSIRCFSSPKRPGQFWVPPSLLYTGYGGAFPPGVKQQGREADHSPLSSAEVKKGGAIPSLPICLHGTVLNSAQGQPYLFTVTCICYCPHTQSTPDITAKGERGGRKVSWIATVPMQLQLA